MGRAFHKSDVENTWQRKFDAVLADNPPHITWVKTRGGVWVASKVVDPHAEVAQSPLRARRQAEHYAQKKAPECMNETLLAAARRPL